MATADKLDRKRCHGNLETYTESQRFLVTADSSDVYKKQTKVHYIIIGLLSFVICVLIGVIVVLTSFKSEGKTQTEHVKVNSKRHHNQQDYIDSKIGPFTEITREETELIIDFMRNNKSLKITDPKQAGVSSNVIHSIELKLAPKKLVVKHLDRNGPLPPRVATVSLFRADAIPPIIEEYEVGPLPRIQFARVVNTTARKTKIPFHVRPFSMAEFRPIYQRVLPAVTKKARKLLYESYGAVYGDCGKKCLKFSMTPISSAFLAKGERKAWFWFAYDIEFYTLHPLDFQFLVDMTDINPENWVVQNVWYANKLYPSLDDLLVKYEKSQINKTRVAYPEETVDQIPTSLHLRNGGFSQLDLEAPQQYEPNGPRYTVRGNKVNYMKWHFTYRISTTVGIQLFDVRHAEERIVYELSMQEIAVLYTAHNPASSMLYFADSAGLFGTRTRGLVPGIDCPTYANYQDIEVYAANNGGQRRLQNAVCIFEQNNLMPLRRHRAYGKIDSFFGGLLDNSLVVRIVISVINYDYVYDFVFHNNGAIEVKVASTGYLASGFYTPAEQPYGTRIRENVVAHLHHHLFHFKADIDVKGTSNRFSTWAVKIENKTDEWSSRPNNWHAQTRIKKSLKQTESSAAYRYNFNHPKYLLFSNANQTDNLGNVKSYRLKISGMSKMKLPINQGFEPSVSWSRYQMAVTKQKDEEYTSSSVYAMWDATDPVVNFQKYLDDDENIVDEDLVSWITLGTYHIPQTEHMPNTPTVGGHLTFLITPFNYYSEDPSMSSRDAIRIDPIDKRRPLNGAYVTRYGLPIDTTFSNDTISLEEQVAHDSEFLFF